jgi:hypothetical protein
VRHFAVIGTRDCSAAQLEWVAGVCAAESGFLDDSVLVTGAAPGIDQAGAEAWLQMSKMGRVLLFLPWPDYEKVWIDQLFMRYPERVDLHLRPILLPEQQTLVQAHHEYWHRLSRGSIALQYRNLEIVRKADAIYATPGTKPWGGGTGLGIRLGLHLEKRMFVFDPLGRNWRCGCTGFTFQPTINHGPEPREGFLT